MSILTFTLMLFYSKNLSSYEPNSNYRSLSFMLYKFRNAISLIQHYINLLNEILKW